MIWAYYRGSSMVKCLVLYCIAFLILVSRFAGGQQVLSHQEVRVTDLTMRTAQSTDSTDVLAAELETIFHDPAICCERNSALGDTVRSAGSLSLKAISAKLAGRHIMNDGRPIVVAADYLSSESANPDRIIAPLLKNHATLMEWNSHFYVMYGVIFNEIVDPESGQRNHVIHKLLLLDARFADVRREATFNRESDDWKRVQGLLTLSATPQ